MDIVKGLVKKFYISKYRDDKYNSSVIADDLTFNRLYNGLKDGEDFYSIVGWKVDELAKMRILSELANRLGVDFEDIITLERTGKLPEKESVVFEYLSDEDQKKEAKEISRAKKAK